MTEPQSGVLTQVRGPDQQTEALRDLERVRDDAKNAERTARHQLSRFLLRNARQLAGFIWSLGQVSQLLA